MPGSPADVKLVGNAMANITGEKSCLCSSKVIEDKRKYRSQWSINAGLPAADPLAGDLVDIKMNL